MFQRSPAIILLSVAISFAAALTSFAQVEAAECSEICQAYLSCVEQSYPGHSTEAQKKTIQEGCIGSCQKSTDAANQCYQQSDGTAGKVASCNEFSACILNVN